MKRRDFLGTVAAGLVSAPNLVAPLVQGESAPQGPPSTPNRPSKPPQEIRSMEFLRHERTENNLPKSAAFREAHAADDVLISAMPLSERLKRGIVPRPGFCSREPGHTTSQGLTSGNGPMVIDVACDPYAEQILFHHESLLMPWKRPFEAPNVASIFPQVRQMILDGKYQEEIGRAHV